MRGGGSCTYINNINSDIITMWGERKTMPTNSIRTGVDSRLLYSTAMQRAFGAGDLYGMHCDAFVQNEGKNQKQKKLNEKKKKNIS